MGTIKTSPKILKINITESLCRHKVQTISLPCKFYRDSTCSRWGSIRKLKVVANRP